MISLAPEPTVATMQPADSPLLPTAWCRRILTSLTHRKLPDRAAGNLEVLLTYFIELDPPAASFVDRLKDYAESSRPEMAKAAELLRQAWRDAHDKQALPPPSLQETLRTLGARLDDAGARAAYLALTPEQVQLQTFGALTQCSLDPRELRLEVAARLALRGQVAPDGPNAPPRYETRLRVIGARLDDEPPQSYELFVTPRTIVVEGSAGYYRSCTLDDLVEQPTPRQVPCRTDHL
ncbi:MAG TPA: hypothetical protein VII06_32700 [Chloroflexota bacterium]|jgi:hypothetical protein